MKEIELELLISDCLNKSNFWKMLDHALKTEHNFRMDSDDVHVFACEVEAFMAHYILNYEPYE
jgi:hypothetical protein